MGEIKGVNLIVDTNYILNRSVFSLVKMNSLFGDLYRSLELSFEGFMNKYPFNKIYMVSDSKSSWRKRIYPEYKSGRKEKREGDEIDWDFVFNTYNDFKSNIKNNRIIPIEAPNVEGDDWIKYLVNKSNSDGYSTVIIASDKDLNQLLEFRLNPTWINIQWVDNYSNAKLYMPSGYEIFLSEISEGSNNIFNLNENTDFADLIKDLSVKCSLEEIDKEKSLFVKIISGDSSDGIDSVLKLPTKTNPEKFMGIGEAGAINIWDKFKSDFPNEVKFDTDEWMNDVIPYILEYKKVINTTDFNDTVKNNLSLNRKLIHLHENYLPSDIKEKIYNI